MGVPYKLIDKEFVEQYFIDWFSAHIEPLKTIRFLYPVLTNKQYGSLEVSNHYGKIVPIILTPYADVRKIVFNRMRDCIYRLQNYRYSRKKKKFVPIFGSLTGVMGISHESYELRGISDAMYIINNFATYRNAQYIVIDQENKDDFLRYFVSQCYLFDKTFPE